MTDWRSETEQLIYNEKMSINRTTDIIRSKYFPDLSFQQVRDSKVRSHLRFHCPQYKKEHKEPDVNKPVGVFGDIHAPYDHPNYLNFLNSTFKKFNVGQIVCMGDIADFHSISRWQKETCADSSKTELEKTQARIKLYTNAFPTLKMCIGNHDERPIRQAAEKGIDREYIKPLNELLHLPKGWDIAEEHVIDGVLYKHGINCVGKDGAINAALNERMSTVIGHSHAFGGCKYSANKREIIFGMNVGCGIDVGAYAFAYGQHEKYRPTLGCGIVFSSSYAIFVPMGAEYFRN